MKENKVILLPRKKYSQADDQDLNLKLDLDTSESLLRVGEKDIVLDIAQLFDKERNDSVKYKIYGKLNMVFRNMYSGSTGYPYLADKMYYLGDGTTTFDGWLPYDEFAFLRKDVLRELNSPSSGTNLTNFTPIFSKTGFTGHTSEPITPITAPYQNWNLYLSYVYGSDLTFPMSYTLSGGTDVNFTSGDGIPFRVVDNGKNYILTSPVPHGISQGEYILLSGGTTTYTNYTGSTYYVNGVGNEIYDSKNYVINLSKSQFKTGCTISGTTIILGKRVLDIKNITGSTSQYYVQKLKTLTETDGYILDEVGFELPIFENERKLIFQTSDGREDVVAERNRPESVLYDFKKPLILSGLTNNLGFTPTEVYVTTIFRNGNGYFNYPPKVGYKFNFHNTWIDHHFSGTTLSIENGMSGNTHTFSGATSGFTFTGGTELPIGTILTGAFVEFNRKEIKERIISDAFHKITSPTHLFYHGQDHNVDGFSGSTPNNTFGIYYQPFHKVKLRELSPYIESAKTTDIYNLPENVLFDKDEKIWYWRDLYDHGYVDDGGYGTDFPFVNGQHYIRNNINFYLRNERYYINKTDGVIGFNDTINRNKNPFC